MRKLVLALLASAPAAAFAQVGGLNAPIGSAADALFGVVQGLVPVIIVLVLVVFALQAMKGKLNPMIMVGPFVVIGSVFSVNKFFRVEPEQDDLPGFSNHAFDWMSDYGPAILCTILLGSFVAYLVNRRHERSALQAQLRTDLRELLKLIELADMVIAYWRPQLELIGARARVETAEKAREVLLPLLEQVHSGVPLYQHKLVREQASKLAKVATDNAGVPFDQAAEPAAAPAPTPAASATPSTSSTFRVDRGARRPAPTQSSSTNSTRSCSCDSTCSCDSGIWPHGSLFGTSHHDHTPHQANTNQYDSGGDTRSNCDAGNNDDDTNRSGTDSSASSDSSTSCGSDGGTGD